MPETRRLMGLWLVAAACARQPLPVLEGGTIGVPADPHTLDPESRIFHHSELTVVQRTDPTYPPEALPLALGTQSCLVRVYISEEGVPYGSQVTASVRQPRCPVVFHEAASACVMAWRWEPPVSGEGEVVKANVHYKLDFVSP